MSGREYGPKIKGLRLGMNYDDVMDIMRKLGDGINAENPRYPLRLNCDDANGIVLQPAAKHTGSFCEASFDEGKLIVFDMSGEALQIAFGVNPSNLSDAQLLQMFLDNYGIPSVKTQTYTFTSQIGRRVGGAVETYGSYDGSEDEGYAFKFRGYKGTGAMNGQQIWRFAFHRYIGWNFDLPTAISLSDVEEYRDGIGPVIKGFQLGMTRAQVMEVVRKIWTDAKPTEEGDRIYFQNGGDFPDFDFRFKNGKVCKFNISGQVFAWLFRADPQYQVLKDFARRAIDRYGIPTAEGKSKSTASQIATCYDCTINDIEFWVEESRKTNSAIWSIGCRYIDASRFD